MTDYFPTLLRATTAAPHRPARRRPLTPAERRLLIRLVRFQNAVDRELSTAVEAAQIDAAIDTGEFSGPAHVAAFKRACDRIANRYGFATAAFAYETADALGVTTYTPAHLQGYAVRAPIPA